MATTYNDYNGNQGTGADNATYTFNFPLYTATDVKVEVDSVVKDVTTHYATSYTDGASSGTITFTSGNIPSSASTKVHIFRDTDVDTQKITFASGSALKAADLNNLYKQLLYAAQEEQNQPIKGTDIGSGIVTSTMITDGTIVAADLADNAVTTAKITDANVTTAKIADNAITTGKIADGTIVDADVSGSAAIALSKLATGSLPSGITIASANIPSGTVIADDLASNSVTSAKITDANVTTAKIADANITTAKIADDAITTGKIAAGAVGTTDLASNAVTTAKITDANVTTAKIADANVTTAKITDANVTTAKLADNAVTTAKITDSNITTAKIADDAVTSAKIADNAITSDHIADGTVVAADIAANAVTSVELADNAVDTAAIAANAVTTAKITDANITTAKIADANVTTAKIADDAVTAAKLNAALGDLSNVDESTSATDGQVLEWDNSATKWKPATISQGSGANATGTVKAIKNNDSQIGGSDIETLDFSSDFTVSENPDKEIQVGIAALVATNKRAFSQNYSIPSDSNASSVGPVTINNTYTVTVPANATWLIH